MWTARRDPRLSVVPLALEGYEMPTGAGWYTTAEVASILGLTQGSIKLAIAHGKLKATKVSRINMITPAALEEYRREHLNKQGWDKRKEPGYQPDPTRQARRERRKAAQHHPPATEPVETTE